MCAALNRPLAASQSSTREFAPALSGHSPRRSWTAGETGALTVEEQEDQSMDIIPHLEAAQAATLEYMLKLPEFQPG